MPLDPEIAAILAQMPAMPPVRSVPVATLRLGVNQATAAAPRLDVPLSSITDRTIEGPGGPLPVRSSEALIEVTYQAQIIPGWTLQPDFQYVFRPGGNVSNARDPNGAAIKDAAIFGLRTTIRY